MVTVAPLMCADVCADVRHLCVQFWSLFSLRHLFVDARRVFDKVQMLCRCGVNFGILNIKLLRCMFGCDSDEVMSLIVLPNGFTYLDGAYLLFDAMLQRAFCSPVVYVNTANMVNVFERDSFKGYVLAPTTFEGMKVACSNGDGTLEICVSRRVTYDLY